MRNLYLRIACFITGYNFLILQGYDGYSQRKIGALAIAMFFPTAIYAFDGYMITRRVCDGTLGAALAAMLIVGLLIFFFEKVIAMSKVSRFLACVRLLLACGMSVIGTIGAKTALFEKDIKREVAKILLEQHDQFSDQIRASHKKDLQAILNTEKIYEGQFNDYAKRAANEPGGTHSTKPGHGNIARGYERQRDYIADHYMRPQMARVDSVNKLMDAQVATEDKEQADNIGLWTKMEALFRFAFRTPQGRFFFATLFVVLFCLELMVLALKIGMPKSPFEMDEEDVVNVHAARRAGQNYHYSLIK